MITPSAADMLEALRAEAADPKPDEELEALRAELEALRAELVAANTKYDEELEALMAGVVAANPKEDEEVAALRAELEYLRAELAVQPKSEGSSSDWWSLPRAGKVEPPQPLKTEDPNSGFKW